MPRLPERLLSDNGPEFVSEAFKEVLRKYGIQHTFTTPLHPASNGAVERLNRTICEMLRCNVERTDCWDEIIPKVVIDYNHSSHATIGSSPSEFLLTVQHQLEGDAAVPDEEVTWKKAHNSFVPFSPGDFVLKKVNPKGHCTINKITPRFTGPWRIASVNPNKVTYLLENERGDRSRAHHTQLRPFVEQPSYLREDGQSKPFESFDVGPPLSQYETDDESDSQHDEETRGAMPQRRVMRSTPSRVMRPTHLRRTDVPTPPLPLIRTPLHRPGILKEPSGIQVETPANVLAHPLDQGSCDRSASVKDFMIYLSEQDEILSSIENSLSISGVDMTNPHESNMGITHSSPVSQSSSRSPATAESPHHVLRRTYAVSPVPNLRYGMFTPNHSGEQSASEYEPLFTQATVNEHSSNDSVSAPRTTWVEIASRRVCQQQSRLSTIRDAILTLSASSSSGSLESPEPAFASTPERPIVVELPAAPFHMYRLRSRGIVPDQPNVPDGPLKYRLRRELNRR